MRLILRSLIILFAVMLLYAVQRVYVMRLGYEIQDLKNDREQLEQIHKSLLIEKAALTSAERVEKIATAYLEMKRPGDNQIVLVREGSTGEKGFRSAKAAIEEKETDSQLRIVKYFDWKL